MGGTRRARSVVDDEQQCHRHHQRGGGDIKPRRVVRDARKTASGANSSSACIDCGASAGSPRQRPRIIADRPSIVSQYFELHPLTPQTRLIRRAAEIVRAGGVIAYPTDSCYALGCHIGDKTALERVRRIRQADRHHHFTLVCRNLADVGRFAKLDDLAVPADQGLHARPVHLPAARDRPRRRGACSTSGDAPSASAFPITRCRACCSRSSASRS